MECIININWLADTIFSIVFIMIEVAISMIPNVAYNPIVDFAKYRVHITCYLLYPRTVSTYSPSIWSGSIYKHITGLI